MFVMTDLYVYRQYVHHSYVYEPSPFHISSSNKNILTRLPYCIKIYENIDHYTLFYDLKVSIARLAPASQASQSTINFI
jgi:hypothetical protein